MEDYDKSRLYSYASNFQKTSGILAILCAVIGLIFLLAWMGGEHKSQACLGGFDFGELIFNFHPIFMYSGMILFALSALLSYRVLPFTKHFTKNLHGILHTCSIMCVIFGLTCVFVGNNYKSKNDYHVYYPNLFTLHSFLGLGAVLLYFQNYLLGIYHFLSSLEAVTVEARKEYMPMHIFLGTMSLILAFMTVETGIMELTTELQCYYEVSEPDNNPASNYHLLKYGCKLANGAGVMVMLVAVFGLFALYNFRPEAKSHETQFLIDQA